MPRERAEIAAALSAKGFTVQQKGRDHDFYFFEHPNKVQPIYTKLSRGTDYREIADGLLRKISRQLHLTGPQFKDLIDCPMGKQEYIAALQACGALRKPSGSP